MIELSSGIVGATLYFLELMKSYRLPSSSEFIRTTPFLQNTKTGDVLAFAAECGLTLDYQGTIFLSEFGAQLTRPGISEVELKRVLLREYIRASKPSWASLITKGRMESFSMFRDDVKTCFLDADLMEKPPSRAVVDWWDEVSNILYGQRSHSKTSIGRQGEFLTLQYETHRTGKAAEWLAIESNRLGYDVLSIVDTHHAAPLLIEVKTSASVFSSALAYITRHEWEIAQRSPNYRFYLWSIYNHLTRLAILEIQDILPHIPQNMGKGHWETVSLNYSAFQKNFVEVNPSFI